MLIQGPHRKTPHDDITIMEKHRRIYPTEAELSLIQRSVCDVEAALKKVSDDLIVDSMAEEEPSNDDVQTKPEIAIKQEVKTNPEVKTKVEEKTEESKARFGYIYLVEALFDFRESDFKSSLRTLYICSRWILLFHPLSKLQ